MTRLNERIRARWKACNSRKKPDALDDYVVNCVASTSELPTSHLCTTPFCGDPRPDTIDISESAQASFCPKKNSLSDRVSTPEPDGTHSAHFTSCRKKTPLQGDNSLDTMDVSHSTPKSVQLSNNFERWMKKDLRQHELQLQSQTELFPFCDCDTSLDTTVSIERHLPSPPPGQLHEDTTFDCSGDIFDQMKLYVDE